MGGRRLGAAKTGPNERGSPLGREIIASLLSFEPRSQVGNPEHAVASDGGNGLPEFFRLRI